MKMLSLLDVEYLAHKLAKDYLDKKDEPIPAFYKHNKIALNSCLELPFQSAFGKECYKGFDMKAAVLFYSLIKNHPFENGNKRIAVTSLMVFSFLNESKLICHQDDLHALSLDVANSPANTRNIMLRILTMLFKKNIVRK